MFNFTDRIKHEKWSVLLTISLSLLVYNDFIHQLLTQPLTNFSDRAIGMTVVAAVDANNRTWEYVQTIIDFFVVFVVAFMILGLLNWWISQRLMPWVVQVEKSTIAILSAFSITLSVLALLTKQIILQQLVWILLGFVGLTLALMGTKLMLVGRNRELFRWYMNYPLLLLGSMIGYCLWFVYRIIFNQPFLFTANAVFGYFVFVVSFWLFVPRWLPRVSSSRRQATRLLLLAGAPLMFIPISIPLSNELQYTLSARGQIAPQTLARVFVMITVGLAVLIFVYGIQGRRLPVWQPTRLLTFFYFPMFLASIYLFGYYRHTITMRSFDLFHQGEFSLPTQQLFNSGVLPFLDIFPTHALSDMLFESLYSLLNGYSGPDMLLWSPAGNAWPFILFQAILLYFFLSQIGTPLFSLLVTLLLPFHLTFLFPLNVLAPIVIGQYFILPPLVILPWVFKKNTYTRYLLLWTTVGLIFLWRYDFGLAIGIALMVVILGFHFKEGNQRGWRNQIHALIKQPLLSLAVVIGSMLVVFSVTALARGYSPLTLLTQLYYYLKIQAPVGAYVGFFHKFSPLVIWQYVLLPLVGIAFLLYFLWAVVSHNAILTPAQYMLAGLAALSLIMSVRSVQRHSLWEGYFPYAFPFLLASAGLYFTRRPRIFGELIFLALFLAHFLVFPTPQVTPFRNGPLFEFKQWNGKQPRVLITDTSQYQDLVAFFDRHLEDSQTFFDFANAPMLYVFANRRFPSYIIPNFYHTSDLLQDYQIQRLNNFFEQNQLPLVIFKQNTFWDAVDGVPNEIRSYRIAEWIYQRYTPMARLGNYELWATPAFQKNFVPPTPTKLHFKPETEFGLNDINSVRRFGETIGLDGGTYDPYIYNFLELGSGLPIDPTRYYWVKVQYRSSMEGAVQVFYSFDGQNFNGTNVSSTGVTKTEIPSTFLVSVPVPENAQILSDIRIDIPNGALFAIDSLELITSSEPLVRLTSISQKFNLQKLPYIWGKYDEKQAAVQTFIQQRINVPSDQITPNVAIPLTFQPDFDKSKGNYLHLRIKSDSEGVVTLQYGQNSSAMITFNVMASEQVEDYLVRLSTQWAWMSEPISIIFLQSSVPITINEALIRQGD